MARYVHSISFVVSDGDVNGVQDMVHVDMNAGSKGKYIYPVIHYTHNRDDAITGWYFVQNDQATPPHFTKIHQDLNQGAGGTFNYLCYTKVGEPKVKHVSFMALHDAYGSSTHHEWKVFGQDLNTGAKRVGRYIYLLYQTETAQEIQAKRDRKLRLQREEELRVQKQVNAAKVKQLRLRKTDLEQQHTHIVQHEFNAIHRRRLELDRQIVAEQKEIQSFEVERSHANHKLILLIGSTGHGKSTFGNRLMDDVSLLAKDGPFPTSYDNGSCTKQLRKCMKNGMSIVDCPGWNDSDGEDRVHINNLGAFLKGCGGINAIVLVIKVGKFDSNFKSKLKYMSQVFGNGFWRHLIIVLSYIDQGMAELQFNQSNKVAQIQRDIETLSNGCNKKVSVIAIGLDNYTGKLPIFMSSIQTQKYECTTIKSPIDDLRNDRANVFNQENEISSRINALLTKIKSIEREIQKLPV